MTLVLKNVFDVPSGAPGLVARMSAFSLSLRTALRAQTEGYFAVSTFQRFEAGGGQAVPRGRQLRLRVTVALVLLFSHGEEGLPLTFKEGPRGVAGHRQRGLRGEAEEPLGTGMSPGWLRLRECVECAPVACPVWTCACRRAPVRVRVCTRMCRRMVR